MQPASQEEVSRKLQLLCWLDKITFYFVHSYCAVYCAMLLKRCLFMRSLKPRGTLSFNSSVNGITEPWHGRWGWSVSFLVSNAQCFIFRNGSIKNMISSILTQSVYKTVNYLGPGPVCFLMFRHCFTWLLSLSRCFYKLLFHSWYRNNMKPIRNIKCRWPRPAAQKELQ